MSEQNQPHLSPAVIRAMAKLAGTVLDSKSELESITFSTPGMEPVVIDKAAATNIRRNARAALRRPKQK